MARKLEVEIVGDASKLQRSLNSAGKSTSSFGSSLKGMGKAAALGAGAAGIGALVVGLKSSLGAAKDAEQAQSRLMDALSSANVSYAKHGEAIDEAIQKTSRLAALDDEDLSDAFAKLVRSTGDVTKATEGMALAADIARARNISLESATKLVEKAQLGSETAFKKVGVEITKGMTATEAFAKAQEQFAGAAEAHSKTAAGAQESLGIAFENLQETIGQKLLPIFAQLVVKLNEAVTWVNVHWPEIEKVFQQGMDKAKAIFEQIKPILKIIIDQIEAIVKLVKAIVEGDWSEVWNQVKAIVENALKAIWEGIKLWKDTIGRVMLALATGAVDKLAEGLKALPGVMLDALKAIPGLIIDYYVFVGKAAFGLGKAIVSGLKDGLVGAAGSVGSAVADAARGAINALIDAINAALEFTIKVPLAPDIHVDAPNIPHLATGVQNFRGGLAVVGERGPELVNLPRGSDVIPNGGGGTAVVHTHVYLDSTQIAEVVRREYLRFEKRNGKAAL